MAGEADFSPEEWALLGDAPLAAAAAVALASPGGGRREAGAMIAGWREAGARFGQHELVAQLAAGLDPEARAEAPARGEGAAYGYESILDEAVDLCSRAVAILAGRASPAELEGYCAFVIHVAERVAFANSEGGLFGPGGAAAMSAEERVVMGAVARALGYGQP